MQTNDPVAAAENLAVLEEEARAFWDKDITAFAACWAPAPYALRGGWCQRGGAEIQRGWTASRVSSAAT